MSITKQDSSLKQNSLLTHGSQITKDSQVTEEKETTKDCDDIKASNNGSGTSIISEDDPYTPATYEWDTIPKQTYTGTLLYGNLHGSGIYFINKENKIFYNGFFYANKLEGYCYVVYFDTGAHFQGLFKNNKRFGPGVLTYPDGTQDIGLWNGFSLIRVGKNPTHYLQSLTSTNEGHVRILKYRYLVDVKKEEETPDLAEELLRKLGASKSVIQKSGELYSKNVKNPNSLFFNKKEYDIYYPDKVPIINILIEDENPMGPACSKAEFLDADDKKNYNQEEQEQDIEKERQENKMFSKKVAMLNSQLEEVKKTLLVINDNIATVTEKYEFCLKCCMGDEAEEEMQSVQEISEKSFEPKPPDSCNLSIADVVDQPFEGSRIAIDLQRYSFLSTPNPSMTGTPVASLATVSVETPMNERTLEDIEKYLKDNICECLDEIDVDDITDLEKTIDKLNKEKLFYENIKAHLKEQIEKLVMTIKTDKKYRTRKIVVDQILAWNNEPLIIEMLKHSFYHRNTEPMFNLKVPEILAGHRKSFTSPGDQENKCYDFFHECHMGTTVEVIRYLREYKINVNVTDAKGNSGIVFACVNNKIDIVKILVQFGANPNQINDDGLTPLTYTLLHYLARKHKIEDWESAFLPDTVVSLEDQQELKSWYPSRSFLSLAQGKSSFQNLTKKAKLSKSSLKKQNSYIFSSQYPVFEGDPFTLMTSENTTEVMDCVPTYLLLIESTIRILIDLGAKPNIGESPLPAFLISLYTENFNIVKVFLDYGANPHLQTPNDNLNALHIMASSKCNETNLDITTLLLRYQCDPNCKTSKNHWPDQKDKLLVNAPEDFNCEDFGKNALHVLCLRRDFGSDRIKFFQKMASLLLPSVDIAETYLGLDALRLAIVSGNLALIQHLLNLGVFNPYQCIPNEGNVLTMLFSNRFKEALSPEEIEKVIEMLVSQNVNPFTPFGEYDNVFDYISKNYNTQKDIVKSKKSVGKVVDKFLSDLESFLSNLATQKLFEYIEMTVSSLLYDFAEENKLNIEILKPLCQYLSPEKFIANLKVLFNSGRIQAERFEKKMILNIIEFILNSQAISLSPTHSETSKISIDLEEYLELIEKTDFRKVIPIIKMMTLDQPGLDEPNKYVVCFECFKKLETGLYTCPNCELVHFCGKKCYLTSLKRKTDRHPCQINLFVDENEPPAFEGIIMKKWFEAKAACNQRFIKRREEEKALKLEQEEQEKKKNIYGIIKKPTYPKTLKSVMKTPTTIVLPPKSSKVSKNNLLEVAHKLKRFNSAQEKKESSMVGLPSSATKSVQNGTAAPLHDSDEMPKELFMKKKTYKGKQDICNMSPCKSEKISSCRSQQYMNVSDILSKLPDTCISSHFEPLPNLKEPYIIKKTKKVPAKPHFFMEILSKLFPDIDLSELLLPYTCYSDGGHLYYEFNNTNLFCRNYSIL